MRYISHMGKLVYDSATNPIVIDDRTLTHLKVVIATKLRRQESFTISWRHPADQPSGRTTIWIHPSIPLRFVIDDPTPIEVNHRWVEALMHSANSTGGLQLVDEVYELLV